MVDYSKWDKMDFSDDSDEEDNIMPHVTRLDEPTSVTFGGNSSSSTPTMTTTTTTMAQSQSTTKPENSKKEQIIQKWTHNGYNEQDMLYWCQDRNDVIIRYKLPDGIKGKDVQVICTGSLKYKDRYAALTQTEISSSLQIIVSGIPIIVGNIPYPIHAGEDDDSDENEVDWTIETSDWNTKYVVITLHKARPMEDVVLWWKHPLTHLPQQDLSKINDGKNVNKMKEFHKAWNDAHEQFKSKAKTTTTTSSSSSTTAASSATAVDNKNIDKLVRKKYQQLRKEGVDMKEAMKIARSEFGIDKKDNKEDVGSQVAAMFGL